MKWLLNPPETEVITFGPEPVYQPDPALEAEYEAMLAEFAAAGAPLDGHPTARIMANPGPYGPLLVDWLERSDRESTKQWVLQLLGVIPTRLGSPTRWYASTAGSSCRTAGAGAWATRCMTSTIARSPSGLLPLATDPRQGVAAQMALIALGRAKYRPAFEPLIERLAEPEVSGHAVDGLRHLGDRRALPALEQTTPESEYARTARQRAIRALQPAA